MQAENKNSSKIKNRKNCTPVAIIKITFTPLVLLYIIYWEKKNVYFDTDLHWEKAIQTCYNQDKTTYFSSLWGKGNELKTVKRSR